MTSSHQHKHPNRTPYGKAFAIGIALNSAFIVVEVVYGLVANSSALLADAGHNLSDVLGLAFAWTAAWLSTIKPKGKYTFGLRKSTILVSVLNALLLFGAVIFIGMDAISKFKNPDPIAGVQVMVVAGIGFIINSVTALFFVKGRHTDLNIKGAFLHMAADAGVSLGVVIGGLLITLTGKLWIDPAISFLIIAVILWGAWRLFTDSIDLALDAVPKHIKVENVRNFFLSKTEITDIHDLHIWAMSTTEVALSVHIVTRDSSNDISIVDLQDELKTKFGIGHSTFQIENEEAPIDCNIDC